MVLRNPGYDMVVIGSRMFGTGHKDGIVLVSQTGTECARVRTREVLSKLMVADGIPGM
jgi:hypothetical protein